MNKNDTVEYIRSLENIYPLKEWKLSLLDQSCYPMVIRGTWIFDVQLDVNTMKTGLKKLLNYYPLLSGRMKDKKTIYFTNDGVPFTVKDESDLTIKDVHKMENLINHFTSEIKPPKIMRGIDPPMSIKITKLKNGCVLGIQCSHMLMDGYSFYTMVYNLGKICKKEDFKSPLLNQSLIPSPENRTKDQVLKTAYEYGWKKISKFSFLRLLPKLISGILKERSNEFYISPTSLQLLKEKISANNLFTCSTNTALSAFITKMFMKLFEHDEKTKCKQVTVANIRNRLEGIPTNFVGNASTFITTPLFLAGASVDEIAKIIHQTLEPIRQTPSQKIKEIMTMSMNLMHHKLLVFPFDFTKIHSKKPTVIHINNFSRLPIYDIDFGSGKPVSVIPHDLGDQVLIWPAHPDKGGWEIYFAGMPARIIHKLKEEDSWLREMKQYSSRSNNKIH
ncbi:hypothetical protein AYK25_09160 [Thermoplasmatales archaeon SM1-50]|nr:MAG: hypothetical protein AYK25_09160 [Thermoplasmatales archaeon SM1-50]